MFVQTATVPSAETIPESYEYNQTGVDIPEWPH